MLSSSAECNYNNEYEAHQERVLARINKHNNQQALSHSIEEGLKIQAMNRYGREGREGGRFSSCFIKDWIYLLPSILKKIKCSNQQ